MNRLIKNMFMVIVIALMLSIAFGGMSRACKIINNNEVIYADSNEPEILPEMVPGCMRFDSIEDPNDEPNPIPEMVPNYLCLNEDPNEPAEMVPVI